MSAPGLAWPSPHLPPSLFSPTPPRPRPLALTRPGSVLWNFTTEGRIWGSPAIDTKLGQLYFGGKDARLYALDLTTGALKWKFQFGAEGGFSQGSPAVTVNHTVLYGSADGSMYLFSSAGAVIWSQKTGAGGCGAGGGGGETGPATGVAEPNRLMRPKPPATCRRRGHNLRISDPCPRCASPSSCQATGCSPRRRWAQEAWSCLDPTTSAFGASTQAQAAKPLPFKPRCAFVVAALRQRGDTPMRHADTPSPPFFPPFSPFIQGGVVSSPAIGDNATFFVGGLDGHVYAVRRQSCVHSCLPRCRPLAAHLCPLLPPGSGQTKALCQQQPRHYGRRCRRLALCLWRLCLCVPQAHEDARAAPRAR